MTLQEAQATTTSSEFVEWCAWMDAREARTTRDHYYLAQIAAEVRRGNTKPSTARRIKIRDFLLRFTATPKDKPTKPSPQHLAAMKAVWFARVHYKGPR